VTIVIRIGVHLRGSFVMIVTHIGVHIGVCLWGSFVVIGCTYRELIPWISGYFVGVRSDNLFL
jgi:hypothetical protein